MGFTSPWPLAIPFSTTTSVLSLQSTRLWERLGSCKTLVVEGREAGKGFEEAMGRYYEAVRAGRGALFFAVCRGKVRRGPGAECVRECGRRGSSRRPFMAVCRGKVRGGVGQRGRTQAGRQTGYQGHRFQ